MPILTDQERCGTVLADTYRLDSILGRGGMGVVFRGHDGHEPVAVKLLRPEYASDQGLAKRFVREANAAAKIRHPNVVEVRDLGIEPDGTIYQVLQLLEGQPLREHLHAKGKMSLSVTLEVLLPVMSALAAAHALGIVHRDLKPDNIYLARQPDGSIVPKLLDFGIAKLLDGQGSFATNTGSVMGTPAYMPPEQATGAKEQGPLVDVWAMGVIVYECLTGQTPFDSSTVAHVMMKIISETPERLDTKDASIPEGIATAVEKALERELDRRHGSIVAFADALREGARQGGVALPDRARSSIVTALSLSPPAMADAPPSSDPGEISVKLDGLSVRLEGDPAERRKAQDAGTLAPASSKRGFIKNTVVANASQPRSVAPPAMPSRSPIAIAMVVALTLALGVAYAVTRAPEAVPAASVPVEMADAPVTTTPTPDRPAAQPVVEPPAVATTPPPAEVEEVEAEVPTPPPEGRGRRPRHTPDGTGTTDPTPTEPEHETPSTGLPNVVEW